MELEEYDIKRNKLVMTCWSVIIVVLIVAYFIEVIKGNRSMTYFVEFFSILVLPYICTYIFMKQGNFKDLNLKYAISVFYLIFYAFTMFTTVTTMSFVYIFPLISVLIVYMDKKLLFIDYSVATIINIIKS